MVYGQMLMAFLATLLLSMFILSMNKNTVLLSNSIDEYKVKEICINKAQSIIDDAQNLRFDESTAGYTAAGALGLDGTESYTNHNIDDFDDYDGYQNTVFSDTLQLYKETGKNVPNAVFRIRCTVNYVDIANLDLPVNNPTRYKRLEVCVWSDAYLNPLTNNKPDTVKMYTICGDWPPSI